MSSTITQTHIGLPAPLSEDAINLDLDGSKNGSKNGSSNGRSMRMTALADGPTPPDPSTEDQGNIFYINAIPDIPEAKDMLKNLQADTDLSSSFWSSKATESSDLKIKEGKLPSDSSGDSVIKRTNYRIQVIEAALQRSGWMSQVASQNASKKFTVAKDQLHGEILNTVLSGLMLSPSVYANFEKVLKSIGDSLTMTKDHSANQNKWILITTYRYDSVQQRIFAGMRSIYFTVTQNLTDYNNSKHDKGTNANIELLYKQDDYTFNGNVWDGFKQRVQDFVNQHGFPIDPIDVPV